MTPARRRVPPAENESGFVLIEILVSALILAIVAGAVFTVLQSTTRSVADQRRHSIAQALAQEDQARLRTMRISALNRLKAAKPVTVDGNVYTVESIGTFVNNTTGTVSCAKGQTSADYVQITTSVTWPGLGKRPAVTMQSVIAPSNGSLNPLHGTLTINAVNGALAPLAGVGLSLSGTGTASGSTNAEGCANFADMAPGKYTLTPSAPGLVGVSGEAPKSESVEVVSSSTKTVDLRYDLPGAIPVQFEHRVGSTATFKTAKMDSLYVYHGETKTLGKAFLTSGGARATQVTATSLFPFSTAYKVYAGACDLNNPNPNDEKEAPGVPATANVLAPAGKTAAPATIKVPSLEVTVRDGSTRIQGAAITIEDDLCNDANGFDLKRLYTSEKEGHQSSSSTGEAEYGMPWGQYDVCAYRPSKNLHKDVTNISVKSLTSSAVADINMSSGTSSGSC
jgi:type II secretory pathway pseudopilin PulG